MLDLECNIFSGYRDQQSGHYRSGSPNGDLRNLCTASDQALLDELVRGMRDGSDIARGDLIRIVTSSTGLRARFRYDPSMVID